MRGNILKFTVLIMTVLLIYSYPANAEDLTFTEDEVPVVNSNEEQADRPTQQGEEKEDLVFTEEEVLLVDPRSTKAIIHHCYCDNICPRHLTKKVIANGLVDAEAPRSDYPVCNALPKIPRVSVSEDACDKVRQIMRDKQTGFFKQANQWTGGLKNNAECQVFLNALGASELYHKHTK